MTQNEKKHGMRKQECAALALARYVELIEQTFPEITDPIETIVRGCCREVQTILITYALKRADNLGTAQGDDAANAEVPEND